jgi:DNA invertase Pin-like site-specific DNA recombinase
MSEFQKRYFSGVGAWYIRVSTDQQDTQRQHDSVAAWLARHNLIVSDQFQFEDHGLKRDQPEKRPEFMRMLKMAEAGLINWIVSDSQDRFGTKDKYQFMSFMHVLRQAGCKFLTVDDKCWTDDNLMSFFEGGMGAETSEKEQKEKSKRVLEGMITKAKQGVWLGGHVPYGIDIACYDPNGDEKWRVVVEGRDLIEGEHLAVLRDTVAKGHSNKRHYSTRRLKVWADGRNERFDGWRSFPATEFTDVLRPSPSKDKATAAAVTEVFAKFASEAISPTHLARHLNDLGVEHHYADTWEHYHIREMLKNPIYIGRQRFNSNGQGRFFEFLDGERRPVTNPSGRRERSKKDWILSEELFAPIVPKNIWDAVQRRIDGTPRESRSPRSAGLWLSGLLFCSHCGKKMRGRQTENRCEYTCSTYARDKNNTTCLRHCISHQTAEQHVMKYLDQTGMELQLMMKAFDTGNLDILKPLQEKHLKSLIDCFTAASRMAQSIRRNEDWEWMLAICCGKKRKLKAPESLEEFHDALTSTFAPLQTAYQAYFQGDKTEVESRHQKLHEEHERLTQRFLSLDESTMKRAADKIREELVLVERQMDHADQCLENWSDIFQAKKDQMFESARSCSKADDVLNDPAANLRRKAAAVKECIEEINLTFRPTGKKYSSSELVEVEIIPRCGDGSGHPEFGLD